MANEQYHVPGATNDNAYGFSADQFSVNYLRGLYSKVGAWKHLRSFDADVSAYGESVYIPSFPRLTPVSISPTDGTFTYNASTIGKERILINNYKAVPFSVTEMVKLQSKVNVMEAYPAEAAKAISNAVDASIAANIASLSTNSAGSLGSDLTETILDTAIEKLVKNYVPLDTLDDLMFMLPASQFAVVNSLKNTYTTQYRLIAPSTDSNGTADLNPNILTYKGIPIFWRNDADLYVTGGALGGLFYRDSYGVAIQRAPSMLPPVRIPGTVNTELTTLCLFGSEIIKDAVACKILTKGTAS